jgi:hypothetical protein
VTEAVRTIQGTFGQLNASVLQILEQASSATTLAKGKGHAAEKQIRTGSITSLANYRIAVVARRLAGQGADVKESGGLIRGGFVVGGLLKAKITGDQAAIQLARGQLASAPITFQAYVDGAASEGQEHGFWFLEESTGTEAIEA